MSVIREISLRSSNFNSCHFILESKASNVDAHNLAKHYLLLDHLWLLSPYDPACIPLDATIDQ